MDLPDLNKVLILGQFDRLREEGKLLWTPPTAVEHVTDNGFQFEFRVCPSQKSKPWFPEGELEHSPEDHEPNGHKGTVEPMPEDMVPGLENQSHSDIDQGALEWHIAHVNNTHRLIFNMYCIYRPQYILLTRDPFQRQTTPLDLSDFKAAFAALDALKSPHYIIFNCGKAAGGSRMHKHMQLFEKDPETLLPDKILSHPDTKSTIPFQFFLTAFGHIQDTDSISFAALAQIAYQMHVRQCAASLGLEGDTRDTVCHNVVMTKSWLMTIPRRKAGIDAATANAAGFMGLVWVPESSVVELWKKLGPTRTLESLGVPLVE